MTDSRGKARRFGMVIAIAWWMTLLAPLGLDAQPTGPAIVPDMARLEELIKRDDRSAIPGLKEAFGRITDKVERQRIAMALVRLGEPDTRYWEFLRRHAEAAVASDIPFPYRFDSQGRTVRGNELAPEFLAWCKRRGVEPAKAAWDVVVWQPGDILFLAMAADPRAFDLLVRALDSQNYFIVLKAAEGLARLHDNRAIKPLIEAGRRVPAEFGKGIGKALVFFSDPQAQAAAERLIPDKAVLDAVRERALEGPKAIFGF